jgi:hypothetical protein
MRTVLRVAADRRCLGEILKGRSGEERTRTNLQKWNRFPATWGRLSFSTPDSLQFAALGNSHEEFETLRLMALN